MDVCTKVNKCCRASDLIYKIWGSCPESPPPINPFQIDEQYMAKAITNMSMKGFFTMQICSLWCLTLSLNGVQEYSTTIINTHGHNIPWLASEGSLRGGGGSGGCNLRLVLPCSSFGGRGGKSRPWMLCSFRKRGGRLKVVVLSPFGGRRDGALWWADLGGILGDGRSHTDSRVWGL